MKFQILVLLVISLLFFIKEIVNLDSYSSNILTIFKFVFSISLSFLLSYLTLVNYNEGYREFSKLFINFIVYPCTFIVFIGLEMLTYGKMGNKEYQ